MKKAYKEPTMNSLLPSPKISEKNMIVLEYDGFEISLTEDGWFNATKAASRFLKRPIDWIRLDETQKYLKALCAALEISEPKSLIKSRRNSGTWLHPKLAVRFAQWLDVDFAVWCDIQIDNIIRGTHQHYDWRKLRHEAASSYKVMDAVLMLVRQTGGKPTMPYHYANEAKLVNWVITGEFKGLDREQLCEEELDLLAKLQERNAVLIGCGLCREERKLALSQFSAGFNRPMLAEKGAA
jgi:hypothetical protein